MTLTGLQGLCAEDYELVYNDDDRVLHVIGYDPIHTALCGRGPEWDHEVLDKSSASFRPWPLCRQCVEKNVLYDLRTTEDVAGICPTACDDGCDADCHETHQVSYKQEHDSDVCPG